MKERGSALVVILILTVLVIGLVSKVAAIAPMMIAKLAVNLRSEKLYDDLVSELLDEPIITTPSSVTCQTRENQAGLLDIKASLCAFERDDYFLNIDELVLSECAQTISLGPNTTLAGHPLSPESLRAASTCTELPSIPNDHIIYEENLDYPESVNLSGEINFLGYVALTDTLRVQNDSQLFAGGDIILNQIVSDAPIPPRLFLHSRTGEISVQGVQGVTLICIAKVHNCSNPSPNLYWAPTSKTSQRLLYFE